MPFRAQFEGKHIRNAEGQVVSVAVLKAGTRAEGQEQVDAISGATITSTGVSTMLNEELVNNYVEFLTGEAGPTAESDPTAEGGLTGEAGQFITEE
jgi:Na+-transporting NADH:ubiquinone oxidoreductase subunit C